MWDVKSRDLHARRFVTYISPQLRSTAPARSVTAGPLRPPVDQWTYDRCERSCGRFSCSRSGLSCSRSRFSGRGSRSSCSRGGRFSGCGGRFSCSRSRFNCSRSRFSCSRRYDASLSCKKPSTLVSCMTTLRIKQNNSAAIETQLLRISAHLMMLIYSLQTRENKKTFKMFLVFDRNNLESQTFPCSVGNDYFHLWPKASFWKMQKR